MCLTHRMLVIYGVFLSHEDPFRTDFMNDKQILFTFKHEGALCPARTEAAKATRTKDTLFALCKLLINYWVK